jgi:nucleoside-diphosphate-sugar epimerase
MNKKIWLSGSRGFIGSYLKESLIKSGNILKCVSNSTSKDDSIIFIDFSSKDSIRKMLNKYGAPDTFIHLGWGNVYEPHSLCHLNENLSDGINLIDELYASGVKKILLIGSSSEYGDRVGSLKESYLPSGEVNNYVKGKIALSNYGIEAAEKIDRYFMHIRLFYTYGAGQKHNSLINQLFKSSLSGDDISLSPCEHFRDYIHVSDAAEGISELATIDFSGIINLGSGNVIKLKEFVKLFWKACKADSSLLKFGKHDLSSLEQSQPKSFANISKLISLSNWSPSIKIEEGIDKTVSQMQDMFDISNQ